MICWFWVPKDPPLLVLIMLDRGLESVPSADVAPLTVSLTLRDSALTAPLTSDARLDKDSIDRFTATRPLCLADAVLPLRDPSSCLGIAEAGGAGKG